MSREQALADHIFGLPQHQLEAVRGHPAKVCELIEQFSAQHLLTITSPQRAAAVVVHLKAQYKKNPPKVMLELGGYIGYSAILFSHQLAPDSYAQYYSFESNKEHAKIARQLVDLAGLTNRIEIVDGKASNSLQSLGNKVARLSYVAPAFVYLDHGKELFIPDLRVLETLNLIAPGTVVVAANSYAGGVPEYVRYVRGTPAERREYNYDVRNVSGKIMPGRWNMLYESKGIELDDEGLEITRCIDYLNG
ncbi:S-adenosyl-L-methionine-dependent methyltransferase [Suhomyces tanzawaensis NRRL Y-17324]|uniref:catechol O-methyltransferase n=1 Tax=Suhomyces tanzawaensis NRRL Y-17324 TaxID=984487 RepID=A0A1E4SJ14_9ASCO|nr:S-adenosyl-L-methionine-dependent methyltransferase [Suhomyces tanzawaensis NRRL Y-17324]ODV79480.1 S-adenosyl-L-methionine-dependent methyltransferase [Suhomyces tanzawaensis NRRL Y-17324]